MIIGHYFWFRLPNRALSLERVRRAWRAAGLDLRHLPEQRKPADVAAEAITAVAGTMLTSTFVQVENSNAHLLYRVQMRNRGVDSGTELLFDKGTGAFSCLDEHLLSRARQVYEQNSTKLPAHKQRYALRTLLLWGGAEYLNPVYFMPVSAECDVNLHSVRQMVRELYADAVFHFVPVIHSAGQVDYLQETMDGLLTLEIIDLHKEVQRMIEDEQPRKWRSDKVEGVVQCQRALTARTERFATLLDKPLERASTAAEKLNADVTELLAVTEGPVVA